MRQLRALGPILLFCALYLIGVSSAVAQERCEHIFDSRQSEVASSQIHWNSDVRKGPGFYPRPAALRLDQIHYQVFGDLHQGIPLVLVHGANTSMQTFRELAQKLSQNQPVIIYDQRGSGKTPETGRGSYDLEVLASDLLSLVDGLGIQRIDLLGHSAGGLVSLIFAGNHPERVRSLSLEDISGLPFKPRTELYAVDTYRTIEFLRRLGKTYNTYEDFAQVLGPLAAGRDDKFISGVALKGRDPMSQDVFDPDHAAGVEEEMIDVCSRDLSEFYLRYQGPLLMMRAGKTTRYFSEAHLQRIYELRPAAQIVVIPEAGHAIHTDQPALWQQTLQNFLSQSR